MIPHDANLIEACRDGNLARARSALADGADIHANDDAALDWAAFNGHAEIVGLLLVAGADVHAHHDRALCGATYNGRDGVAVVRLLLNAGADIHADREKALCWAAFNGCVDIMQMLLDAGANPMAAWLFSTPSDRDRMAPAFDACAGMMTPNQRAAMVMQSACFKAMQAPVESERQHKSLQR